MKKKHRTFIQKITGRGKKKPLPTTTTGSLYGLPRYVRTDVSLSSTIKSIPTVLHHPPSSTPPPIVKLDVSVRADTQNIDAQKGGDCIIQCQVTASYTAPPERIGFDGVIVIDNRLSGRKFQLALNAANALVEATISSDRLGLVVGENVVSELIMCTLPYKDALRKSVLNVPSTDHRDVMRGIKLAGGLLSKEARDGGHIFFISDGHNITETPPRGAMVHIIAIGELVKKTFLRNLRGERGIYIEYREKNNGFDVNQLLECLSLGQNSQIIETVRCRLSHPPEVTITSVLPTSLSIDPCFSLTLRKSPYSQNPLPLSAIPRIFSFRGRR